MSDETLNLPEPDVLIAAAFYLMLRYARTDCPFIRHMVEHQLRYLARHPGDGVTPMLRQVCTGLAREWERLDPSEQSVPPEPTAGRLRSNIH